MEAFMVDESGAPCSLTKANEPLIAWLERCWRQKFPMIAHRVSAEQLAHMVEIKTDIEANVRNGFETIWEMRALLNRFLHEGGMRNEVRADLRVIFAPVLDKKPALVPASYNPSSRSWQLFETWSSTDVGIERLYDTSIASCQVNDSVLFADLDDEEAWDLAVALYDNYTFERVSALIARFNDPRIQNHEGLTRNQCLERLLKGVKGKNFLERGYAERHVVYPPRFDTVADLKNWYAAHSNVQSTAEISCKDAHAIGMKVKLKGGNRSPFMKENRWLDASEDMEKLLRATDSTMHFDRRVKKALLDRRRQHIAELCLGR